MYSGLTVVVQYVLSSPRSFSYYNFSLESLRRPKFHHTLGMDGPALLAARQVLIEYRVKGPQGEDGPGKTEIPCQLS